MDPLVLIAPSPCGRAGGMPAPTLRVLALPTIPASGPGSRDDSPCQTQPSPAERAVKVAKRSSSLYSDELIVTPPLSAPISSAARRLVAFCDEPRQIRAPPPRVPRRATSPASLPTLSSVTPSSRRRRATVGSQPRSPVPRDGLRQPVIVTPRTSSLSALGLTDGFFPPRSSSLMPDDQVVVVVDSDTTNSLASSPTHLSSARTSLSRSTRSKDDAPRSHAHLALAEVVETEAAYVDDLRALHDVYLAELARMPGFANSFVAVTGHIARLRAAHEALAAAMLDALHAELGPGGAGRIAQLLLDQRFDADVEFCAGSVATDATVRSLGHRADFQQFEQRCALANLERGRAADALGSPSAHSRYHLADLLITPTQRVCRYPLLVRRVIDCSPDDADAALLALAHEHVSRVAADADAARRDAEVSRSSRLLLDRFEAHSVLTRPFLASLGTYRQAGPLDVVHWHPSVTPRARCVAAILYDDYLILAKVKRASAYEPKHYFPLSACDIKQGGLLPHSILFACNDHQIELAAPSAELLAAWLDAIRAAQVVAVDRPSSFAPALARRQSADGAREQQRHLRRPSASQRHMVDRGLDDVATWRAAAARTARRHSFFDIAGAPRAVPDAWPLRRSVSSYSLDTRAPPAATKSMPVSPVRATALLPDGAASPGASPPVLEGALHASPRPRARRSLSIFRTQSASSSPAEPDVATFESTARQSPSASTAATSAAPSTAASTTPSHTPRRKRSILSVVSFLTLTSANEKA